MGLHDYYISILYVHIYAKLIKYNVSQPILHDSTKFYFQLLRLVFSQVIVRHSMYSYFKLRSFISDISGEQDFKSVQA